MISALPKTTHQKQNKRFTQYKNIWPFHAVAII